MSQPHKRKYEPDIYTIRPLKLKKDDKPLLGRELLDYKYSNSLFVAQTKSGKTTALHHMIKHCADKRTAFYIICPSVEVDDVWQQIIKLLERKKCSYHVFKDLFKGGKCVLTGLADTFCELDRKAKEDRKQHRPSELLKFSFPTKKNQEYDEEGRPIPARAKGERKEEFDTVVPERWVIIDDANWEDLHRPEYTNFIKKSRHNHVRTTTCAHGVKQCLPNAYCNLFSIHLWAGMSEYYLKAMLQERMPNFHLKFDDFLKIYQTVTGGDNHDFLSIYPWDRVLRMNFYPQPIDLTMCQEREKAEHAEAASHDGRIIEKL